MICASINQHCICISGITVCIQTSYKWLTKTVPCAHRMQNKLTKPTMKSREPKLLQKQASIKRNETGNIWLIPKYNLEIKTGSNLAEIYNSLHTLGRKISQCRACQILPLFSQQRKPNSSHSILRFGLAPPLSLY